MFDGTAQPQISNELKSLVAEDQRSQPPLWESTRTSSDEDKRDHDHDREERGDPERVEVDHGTPPFYRFLVS